MDAVQACGCCMIALDDVAIPDGKDSREQLQGYLGMLHRLWDLYCKMTSKRL